MNFWIISTHIVIGEDYYNRGLPFIIDESYVFSWLVLQLAFEDDPVLSVPMLPAQS